MHTRATRTALFFGWETIELVEEDMAINARLDSHVEIVERKKLFFSVSVSSLALDQPRRQNSLNSPTIPPSTHPSRLLTSSKRAKPQLTRNNTKSRSPRSVAAFFFIPLVPSVKCSGSRSVFPSFQLRAPRSLDRVSP
jgi:hypothetical protein